MGIKKKSILGFVFLTLFSANSFASQFCDGFAQGYITGYRQAQRTNLSPLVPFCPMQPLKGFGDPQSDFEQGYIVGLREGMAASSR